MEVFDGSKVAATLRLQVEYASGIKSKNNPAPGRTFGDRNDSTDLPPDFRCDLRKYAMTVRILCDV